MPLTDKISRVTNSTTGRPIVATLASPGKAIAAASITISAATNWDTVNAQFFTIYNTVTVAGIAVKDGTTQTDWKGTLTGTVISNLTLTGGTDRAYTAGAIVELTPTAAYAKELFDNISTHANPDGTIKNGAISATAMLGTGVVTSTNILDANVTAAKLATDAITLGYAQITSSFSTVATTPTLITGLSATVTIPAGGRKIRITVSSDYLLGSAASNNYFCSIWDGTVGSGTSLRNATFTTPAANATTPIGISAIVTPVAGTKTYSAGLHGGGGTATLAATASNTAFIHVEVV